MSGPTAGTFTLEGALIAAAAEAIRGAMAIAEGYAAERERQAELQGQRQSEAAQRREVSLAARRAMAEEIAREESRLRRLISARDILVVQLTEPVAEPVVLPARPADSDLSALAPYLGALRTQAEILTGTVSDLAAHSARSLAATDLAVLVAAAPNMAEQLAAFEAQARLSARVPPTVAAERRAQVERILARAVIAADTTLPEELEALVNEIMRTLSAERAEALATELRLRVVHHNESASADAAALVLEQSLRDLGYEVDGIAETLFVEGGIAHFQRPGWRDYHIRLRVDALRRAINFNVVRAGTPGEDRKHEDMLAEERWCAEFPRLQATLAARGLRVDVTRQLNAGEVPVQVVDAAQLPNFGGEEDRRAVTTPKAMHRP
jgi:hypothetical protein